MSLKIIIFESKIPEDKRYETEYLEDSDLETSIVGSFDSILDIMNNASPDILSDIYGLSEIYIRTSFNW